MRVLEYEFPLSLPLDRAMSIFESPKILDAAHGPRLWKFTPWKPCPKKHDGRTDWAMRKGLIKGVVVPPACRTLNAGKKHIGCIVRQRYVAWDDDTIVVKSTMKPRILGAELVKNVTRFDIRKNGDAGVTVHARVENRVFLPPPLKAVAEMAMNDMSEETLHELRRALENMDL